MERLTAGPNSRQLRLGYTVTYNDTLYSDIPVITISFVVTVKIYVGSMKTRPTCNDWFSQPLYSYNDHGSGSREGQDRKNQQWEKSRQTCFIY